MDFEETQKLLKEIAENVKRLDARVSAMEKGTKQPDSKKLDIFSKMTQRGLIYVRVGEFQQAQQKLDLFHQKHRMCVQFDEAGLDYVIEFGETEKLSEIKDYEGTSNITTGKLYLYDEDDDYEYPLQRGFLPKGCGKHPKTADLVVGFNPETVLKDESLYKILAEVAKMHGAKAEQDVQDEDEREL